MEGYWSLLQTDEKVLKDVDIDIWREDYVNGFALFSWDLTPDLGEDYHFNLIKREVCVYPSNLEKLRRRLLTSSYTPSSKTTWKSIATETRFTILLHKHEWINNQAHIGDQLKNKWLFPWSLLTKWTTNFDTYDIAVRLQHGSKSQTWRTLGDNIHRQRSTRRIFWLFPYASSL